MKSLSAGLLFLCGLLSHCRGDLYFLSVPPSIELSKNGEAIDVGDVSHMISYMMGFSTHKITSWTGVKALDIFNRPKANLFINLHVPSPSDISVTEFKAKFIIKGSGGAAPSLEETNAAIYHASSEKKPVIVDFEQEQNVFNILSYNTGVLKDLPVTFFDMKDRLAKADSFIASLDPASCLNVTQETDVLLLGEIQTMKDILSRLQIDKSSVDDQVPDSYYFTISGVDALVKTYGEQSCQVKEALRLLEKFIPEFTASFNKLYDNQLLAEVNIAGEVKREFLQVRRTRSLMATADVAEVLEGFVEEPVMAEYAIYINIAIWITVAIALAVLGSSYFIWFMDPGRDSIIYRMTTQRMKLD
uniref:Renin receptor n=1 Tax=Phallusia mammillata TaxID=59560 RepID=A0A6F9D7R5_9ASCI|nr:renin receptor-like [Phallusia mammillata]